MNKIICDRCQSEDIAFCNVNLLDWKEGYDMEYDFCAPCYSDLIKVLKVFWNV